MCIMLSGEQVRFINGILLGNLWLFTSFIPVVYIRVLGFFVPRRCPSSCPIWSACPTSPASCACGRRLCECRYRGSHPSQVCDPCVLGGLTCNIGLCNLMCICCVDSLIDKLLLLYVHHHHISSLFHIFTCHLYVVHCWPCYHILIARTVYQ